MADHLHSNCDSLLQSLSELLDGTLSDEMCTEIKQHLESCDNCRAVFNTTRRTIDLVRTSPEGPAGLPEDMRALVQAPGSGGLPRKARGVGHGRAALAAR